MSGNKSINNSNKSVKISDSRGEDVNFHISNTVKLVTLSNGLPKLDQGFRVALPIDIEESGTISAKLKNGPDIFQTIPIFMGGWNDYLITEINTIGHSINLTQIYIGY